MTNGIAIDSSVDDIAMDKVMCGTHAFDSKYGHESTARGEMAW